MEIYEGVKFSFKLIRKKAPKHTLIKNLKYWCAVFNSRNYAPKYKGGSSGNLSFRTEAGKDRFIITAGHTALKDNMSDSDFVLITSCNTERNKVIGKGMKAPSSETLLHNIIYKLRPEINAIFHGHSKEILENCIDLPVPTTFTVEEYGTVELVNSVLKVIGKNNFIIIKEHGFLSLGTNLEEAGDRLKLYE